MQGGTVELVQHTGTVHYWYNTSGANEVSMSPIKNPWVIYFPIIFSLNLGTLHPA